jgi:hypothetical protein
MMLHFVDLHNKLGLIAAKEYLDELDRVYIATPIMRRCIQVYFKAGLKSFTYSLS